MTNFNSLITVLMPIYNGELFLKEAIDSVLNQTYNHFELLIINDGSIDNSEEIILSYSDVRICYVKNLKNIGLIGTLNLGLKIAKGEFIVRMDQDDISLPTRFEKQINFLISNKQVGLIGTAFEFFENKEYHSYALENEMIKIDLIFFNSFSHPTVMFRKEICTKNNLIYKSEYIHAEDYKMWTDFVSKTKVANLPEVLVKYRKHDSQISKVYSEEQRKMKFRIQNEYLNINGFFFSDNELIFLNEANEIKGNIESLKILDNLFTQNKNKLFFDEEVFLNYLLKLFQKNLIELKSRDQEMVSYLKSSFLFSKVKLSFKQKLSLQIKLIKCRQNK